MAMTIVTSPDATIGQKVGAGAYIGVEVTAHVALAVGSVGVLCGLVAPCAAAVEPVLGIGTVACADGNCTNEAQLAQSAVSKFRPSDIEAISKFANNAPAQQAARGQKSFGDTWMAWSQAASQSRDLANNLFIHRTGDKITGMMKVVERASSRALEIYHLEGLGGGAGTRLMQRAIQESIERGYGGRIILHSSQQAVSFYEKLGGILVDPNTNKFLFNEQVARSILKMIP
jgi:hypothetical protein